MKKLFTIVLCLFMSAGAYAQVESQWGVKAGVNVAKRTFGVKGVSLNVNPGTKTGFYIGALNKLQFCEKFGIQTELNYSLGGARLGVKNSAIQDLLNGSFLQDFFLNQTVSPENLAAFSVLFKDNYVANITEQNLTLPILARYTEGGLTIMAGPYISVGLSSKVSLTNKTEKLADDLVDVILVNDPEQAKSTKGIINDCVALGDDLYRDNLLKFDFGLAFGAEYAFKNGIFVEARYNLGLLNTIEHKKLDLSSLRDFMEKYGSSPDEAALFKDLDLKEGGIRPKSRCGSLQIGVGFRF